MSDLSRTWFSCIVRCHAIRAVTAIALCAMLAATPLAIGQIQEQAAPARLSLPSQLPLARLVDVSARAIGARLVYDDQQLRANVTLNAFDQVTPDELWAVTNDLLISNELTTIRSSNGETLRIVRLSEAGSEAPLDEPARLGSRAYYLQIRFDLTHADATAVREIITPLLSRQHGSSLAIESAGLLIVSDFTPRLRVIKRVIESLDQPPDNAQELAPFPLQNASVEDVMQRLSTLREQAERLVPPGDVFRGPDSRSLIVTAPRQARTRWESLLRELDLPSGRTFQTIDTSPVDPAVVQRYAAPVLEQQGLSDAVLQPDPVTGTLTVFGSRQAVESIELIVSRLRDMPASSGQRIVFLKVENRPVDEIASLLEGILGGDSLVGLPGNDGLGSQQTPPIGEGELVESGVGSRSSDESFTVSTDPRTNTIIVSGSPSLLAAARRVVDQLDTREPEVMLEVLMLSLSEGQSLDLGIELQGQLNLNGDSVLRLASLFGLGTPVPLPGDANFGGAGAGGTAAMLSPGDFSVLLRALKTINDGRSLSMPKVLVSNNEEATLDSVIQEPFSSTNASDTVATTSFGGTQDAGTSVSIQPQIAEANHLILRYSVSLSSFVGESATPELPPPRQQNSLQSTVTIPDGFTIAVGGIELLTEAEAETGIPLLSDIPGIGEAFKNRSRSQSRSRFYVFIRASILRDRNFAGLKHLSDQDVAAAAIDDGWPTPEPRLMR